MPVDLFANAANTTLLAAIGTAGATSFTVTSGVKFPTVSVALGTQFRVIIDSELFVVTDSTTATWTVTPGAEGTTAATHLVSAPITAIATAGSLRSLVTGDVQFDAYRVANGSNANSIALAAGSFTTFTVDTLGYNVGGGTATLASGTFTVPATGLYLCGGTVRIGNSQAVVNLGVGIHTSNIDGPWFAWSDASTPNVSGAGSRRTVTYARVARFLVGDVLRLYGYSDGAVLNYTGVDFNVTRIGA